MGACLCISDLHLSEARPATTLAFGGFLRRQASQTHSLYILGDLFDLWIGDDDDSALARSVASDLKAFSDSGALLFLMPGNRDFLLGETFAKRCGATLLPDLSVTELAGTPTLLSHGDALCTDDPDYQTFRDQVRTTQWRDNFLSGSLQQRRNQALALRSESESAKIGKDKLSMDINETAVVATLARHGVSRLIHGHTHRPGRYPLDSGSGDSKPLGERIALDEWALQGNYLKASSNSLELVYFNI